MAAAMEKNMESRELEGGSIAPAWGSLGGFKHETQDHGTKHG